MFMSELQTKENWMGLKRAQQPIANLNKYTNDNKASILSLQKQRMVKRFHDYNYLSQDMKSKAALRHQFINRRNTQYNKELVTTFKDTKFTNMKVEKNSSRNTQEGQYQTFSNSNIP